MTALSLISATVQPSRKEGMKDYLLVGEMTAREGEVRA